MDIGPVQSRFSIPLNLYTGQPLKLRSKMSDFNTYTGIRGNRRFYGRIRTSNGGWLRTPMLDLRLDAGLEGPGRLDGSTISCFCSCECPRTADFRNYSDFLLLFVGLVPDAASGSYRIPAV